jgi:hypothetical protein
VKLTDPAMNALSKCLYSMEKTLVHMLRVKKEFPRYMDCLDKETGKILKKWHPKVERITISVTSLISYYALNILLEFPIIVSIQKFASQLCFSHF